MTLSNDVLTGLKSDICPDLNGSTNSIKREEQTYGHIALFAVAVLVFAAAAFVMGLPGADTNARDTYNVITRLTKTLTYTLSRTPGQPVLDYLNYVFRSVGGDLAVQGWFVVVSAAGVTAFYCMLRNLGGVSPIAAVITLALNPFFLTHVGGVGDFAVSASFLLISLFFATKRLPWFAGAMLALAVGCRLVFCLYALPISVLAALAAHAKGASFRQCTKAGAIAATVAAVLSAIEYAPSFSYWGRDLLRNLPFQGLKYHSSAFLFKLFIGLGAPVLVILFGFCMSLLWRARQRSALSTNSAAVSVAVLIIFCCTAYFFRVPTKPELTLPILIGFTLLVQFCGSRQWAFALMLGSIAVGCVVLSPYDRGRDRYEWHFEDGWYKQNFEEARLNRFQLQIVRALLSTLPPRTILITREHWTIEQAERSDLMKLTHFAGVELPSAFAFRGLGAERILVDPQDGKLRELLEKVTISTRPEEHVTVLYEQTNLGLLRRWSRLDLAQYGRPVLLQGE